MLHFNRIGGSTQTEDTPVVTSSMRNRARAQGIAPLRGADDGRCLRRGRGRW